MSNVEGIARFLASTWGAKTLSTFRSEAAKELNGTAFESLRAENGPRRVLVFCFTGQHEIGKLGKQFKLAKTAPFDWTKTTLTELAARAVLKGGFIYDAEKSGDNRLTALVLMAADPRSITILEQAFNLPP